MNACTNAREWSSRIVDLVRREYVALSDLLLALAEFDRMAAYRELGFATLFDYLHREVGLSRGSAYYRQVGARLVQRFPEVLEPIRDGRLCITSVIELAKVMTESNRHEVLPRFFHCSRQEAKQMVVEIRPAETIPMRTVVTRIPDRLPVLVPIDPVSIDPVSIDPRPEGVQPVEPDTTHPERARTVVEPLSVGANRIHITVSRGFVDLLKRAKAGQSHVQPGATDEDVLRTALELLVEKQERRTASVPAAVKRAVRARDEGRCQWKLASGGICGSTVRLEIDHVVPRGMGGESTVENCRVLCQAHNLEAARHAYGEWVVDRYAGPASVREPGSPIWPAAPPGSTRPRGTTRPTGAAIPPARPAPRTRAAGGPSRDRRPIPARAPARPASG